MKPRVLVCDADPQSLRALRFVLRGAGVEVDETSTGGDALDRAALRAPQAAIIDLVSVGRLPGPIEAAAYFVVAEALTNVSKHSAAERAEVSAHVEHGTLLVEVRDAGIGGVRADGARLVGLADRLAAVEGRLEVDSPDDGGTRVAAVIPLSTSSVDSAAP